APALWRGREIQLDRLSAGTRARLNGDLSGTGLEDQRRGLLGAVDTDPGAEHSAPPCSCNSTCEMSVRGFRLSCLDAGSGAARGKPDDLSSMSFAQSWPSCARSSPPEPRGARVTATQWPSTQRSRWR